MSDLQVLGYRVMIKPDPIEKTTESGIVIETDERLEKAAQNTGTVVSIGPKAYQGLVDDEPWVEVGDHVLYAKYASTRIVDPSTRDIIGEGEEYVIVNDDDVLCRLEKGVS